MAERRCACRVLEMEMFPIKKGHSGKCLAGWILTVALTLMTAVIGHANELSLVDAQAIALDQDPSLRAVESKREALEEMAVASGQLPDPMLKAGFMSLPTDTWNLGQEPMTQVQVGVIQKFPRGKTRDLRSEQMLEQSSALGETLTDQRLRIVLAVREDYFEVLKQLKLAEINAEAIEAFSDLERVMFYG